jgi:hypothetical protein
MNYPKYKLSANTDFTIYEFISIGKKGTIHKAIKFTRTSYDEIYNLGFGDVIEMHQTGDLSIDDTVKSDNGDIELVLATVAYSVYAFTELYPEKFILFLGSTPQRTRLYRMAIYKNMEEISKTFYIFGVVKNDKDELVNIPFDPKDNNVEGFLIKRK